MSLIKGCLSAKQKILFFFTLFLMPTFSVFANDGDNIELSNKTEQIRAYHFGHSLMLHDVSNNPIYDSNSGGSRDDKELSILHWMKQLTDASGG
ncbi:MAG: hypothetical protein ACI9MS_002733, partial [Glaciecola sp.]